MQARELLTHLYGLQNDTTNHSPMKKPHRVATMGFLDFLNP
jgi:hypothetical protein